MEALFELQLTGPEIEAMLFAAAVVLDEGLPLGTITEDALASAKGKLEQAFTTVESAGGG